MPDIQIITAVDPADLAAVAGLFREYARWLQIDCCSANIEGEIAALPGPYSPPAGGLWLARCGNQDTAGCVALRPCTDGIGELKRLYVRPAHRGAGLGRQLVHVVIGWARAHGWRALRLDTIIDRMPEATRLYRAVGFRDIGPYGRHVSECTDFMELRL